MPLAFDSTTHGKIAFGFFNIDVDMLLLEHYFFFADDFWETTARFRQRIGAAPNNAPPNTPNPTKQGVMRVDFQVWDIPPGDVGDLMGAIHGLRHTGFIGEVYEKFPFPKRPDEFKQMPHGKKNRPAVSEIIKKYGVKRNIAGWLDIETDRFALGEYEFTTVSFYELIDYVQRGGMPGWKDETRPEYLTQRI